MALFGETPTGFTGRSLHSNCTRRVARDRELTRLKFESTVSPPSFTGSIGQIIGHCSSRISEDGGVRSPVAFCVPFTLLGTRITGAISFVLFGLSLLRNFEENKGKCIVMLNNSQYLKAARFRGEEYNTVLP